MKKLLEVSLGIATSIGGFLEIGSLVTSAQAGASFGFQLAWAVALGALCLVFLLEMSGRFAAVSKHTIADAIRERFGFNFFIGPLVAFTLVTMFVLGAEIGGVCLALELITGIAFPWWALPVGFLAWLLLWKGTFGIIEKGTSLMGLITVAFAVAAFLVHPPLRELGAGLIPSVPHHDGTRYWLMVVSILGASITPYLFYFYSSGAIEDRWQEGDLGINRLVSGVGMIFGGGLSLAVLVVAAMVLRPQGITVDYYDQLPLMLTPVFGRWGLWLMGASLLVACFGAALEIALAVGYTIAQGFGWKWGENLRPRQAARFSTVYSVAIAAGTGMVAIGIDPLRLTLVSMAMTAAVLPLTIFPFVIVMNDERYLGGHCNGWLSNMVVVAVTTLAFVLAVVSIPLALVSG
jgi:Mn2+/Fe2+ NRAMP family transporter